MHQGPTARLTWMIANATKICPPVVFRLVYSEAGVSAEANMVCPAATAMTAQMISPIEPMNSIFLLPSFSMNHRAGMVAAKVTAPKIN
jgi:hypothetical protein